MRPVLTLLILVTLPPGLRAQFGASPGSLFTPSGRLADPTRDLRAYEAGDLVTIIVSDQASALSRGVTNTSRKSSAKNQITALAGSLNSTNPLASLLNVNGAQAMDAQGQTSRNMVLTTTISARVVEATANGTLVVEGSKDIMVNSEHQTVTLTGLVRAVDLTTANTVRSDQVAGLTIRINGKGVVGDAIRRPFFLYRLLLGLLPF
jgi:flagellar L-ring protein precursor FlgH